MLLQILQGNAAVALQGTLLEPCRDTTTALQGNIAVALQGPHCRERILELCGSCLCRVESRLNVTHTTQ